MWVVIYSVVNNSFGHLLTQQTFVKHLLEDPALDLIFGSFSSLALSHSKYLDLLSMNFPNKSWGGGRLIVIDPLFQSRVLLPCCLTSVIFLEAWVEVSIV